MAALYVWTFSPRDNGRQVITEESLYGWFPRLLKIVDPGFLDKSLDDSLRTLKDEAERRSATR